MKKQKLIDLILQTERKDITSVRLTAISCLILFTIGIILFVDLSSVEFYPKVFIFAVAVLIVVFSKLAKWDIEFTRHQRLKALETFLKNEKVDLNLENVIPIEALKKLPSEQPFFENFKVLKHYYS